MRVSIIQRRLTHYRVPLFERLREDLGSTGVELSLVHGQPTPKEVSKNDCGVLDWATTVGSRYIMIGGKQLCWLPLPPAVLMSDLIIITQENALLSNYPLLMRRKILGPRVAFWGHGANLQSGSPNGLRERFKRWTTRQVDWWFAYSELSVELVARTGFPRERITNLENAADTQGMLDDMASLTPDELKCLRREHGWENARIGIFIGSLYADKRLEFLFHAAERVRKESPDFRLLLVGDGPMRATVEHFCEERDWCLFLGAKKGIEKARYLALADVMLNPGLVGLGILDSFIAGVPIITADCGLHSPEIAYLRPGENGVITQNSLDSFVAGVCGVLNNTELRNRLIRGCQAAAQYYTVENMAGNFVDGISRALAHGGLRAS